MRINKSLIAYTPTTGTGSGSVTSVGFSATVPTGLAQSVSGSPITSAGTIALSLSFAAGYAIPTTIKQSNWDDAYTFVVNFPSQTGNNGRYLTTDGSALSWAAIAGSSITGAALTEVDDTNVTMTLGGTPATALLRSVSMTLGWAGQLAVSRGGTGAATLTGVVIGNGTSAMTSVVGGPNQILRRNSAGTAYEFYTASFLTNPMTLNFDMIYQSGGVPTRLPSNITTTKQFLTSIGNGTATTSLAWQSLSSADITGAALTRTNDTNVQITLGGSASTALLNAASLTMGWTGQLAVGRGGTGAATLTGVVIGNAAANMTAVAGTAGQFLRRNTLNTAYEFRTLQGGDIAGSELTFANDTNVQMTLGGTPASSLLQPVSINLGWTGQLAVGRGGTGASTLTGVLVGNGTSAVTAITGTAGQILRRNALNTAYEFWTANYMTNPMTLEGSIIYADTGGTPAQLFANSTGTRKYLSQINGTAPTWETIAGGGISGTGTTNYVTKWTTGGSVLGNSQILDNGTNIGIGDASPTVLIDAYKATGGIIRVRSGDGGAFYVSNTTKVNTIAAFGDAGGIIGGAADTTALFYSGGVPMAFYVNGAERARIATSGDVTMGTSGFYYDSVNKRLGIGVASPSQALDVSSNFGIAKITSAVGTNATFFQFVNTGGNFFIGSEGSTGATFGATPYASVIRTPDTVPLEIFQGSWKAVELLTTGQFKWNDYLTATSFTGTAAGYLAFTSTGSIITVPVPTNGTKLYRIDFNSALPDTWTNMPSAISFFDGSTAFITAAELSNFTQVRLLINKLGTAGATGSAIILRYNTTYTQNANLWSAIGTTSVQLAVNNTNQFLETAWIDLVAGAKADVFIALMGSGGDGAADPIFGMIAAEFR
jgi:hypothetical protein